MLEAVSGWICSLTSQAWVEPASAGDGLRCQNATEKTGLELGNVMSFDEHAFDEHAFDEHAFDERGANLGMVYVLFWRARVGAVCSTQRHAPLLEVAPLNTIS